MHKKTLLEEVTDNLSVQYLQFNRHVYDFFEIGKLFVVETKRNEILKSELELLATIKVGNDIGNRVAGVVVQDEKESSIKYNKGYKLTFRLDSVSNDNSQGVCLTYKLSNIVLFANLVDEQQN